MDGSVYIFWDNSSIFVGAQHAAADRENLWVGTHARVQYANLCALARAGRPVAKAVCAGSGPCDVIGPLRHRSGGWPGFRRQNAYG
ncbi:MAG: hypothetical protein AB1505_09025 [Candidatus Latescibacterota bacterium]